MAGCGNSAPSASPGRKVPYVTPFTQSFWPPAYKNLPGAEGRGASHCSFRSVMESRSAQARSLGKLLQATLVPPGSGNKDAGLAAIFPSLQGQMAAKDGP